MTSHASSSIAAAAARRLACHLAPTGSLRGVRRSPSLPLAALSSLRLGPSSSSSSSCSISTRFFSTEPRRKVLELPPNLKFDPKCVSSPFYDAERVSLVKKAAASIAADATEAQEDEVEEDKVDGAAANDAAAPEDEAEEYNDGEEYDEEDEDEIEERILYDLSTKPDIPRALPLAVRLQVPILDLRTSEEVGTIHLSDLVFGNDPVRVDVLHRVVVYQRNKKRGLRNAGAKTKTIGEISGSGRKVRAQKGGGVARAGHSRPAHWRGGYKAHGPKGKIQNYETKLNKKVRKMGVRHALSQKLKEGNLVITSDLAAGTHKTKEMNAMLANFGVGGRDGATALLIDDAEVPEDEEGGSVYGGLDVNLKVASGNIHKIKVLNQLGCNVYDMLKFEKLFLSLAALRTLEERLEKGL